MKTNRPFVPVAIGALALATTALPLLSTWLTPLRPFTPRSSMLGPTNTYSPNIVVDLRDNVSDADIAQIERDSGIDLDYNSVHAQDDKLMRASVDNTHRGPDSVLAMLRRDPRVESAEREQIFTFPQNPLLPAEESWQHAKDAARAQVFGARPAERPVLGWNTESANIDVMLDSHSVARLRATPRFLPASSALGDNKPNDPRYDEQWNFEMVGAEKAWKRSRGKNVIVAVIDTGVAAQSTSRGKQCRDFNTTTFTKGYDFVHNDSDPYDDHGHGTHVAGTVAESTNNREGVAGLAFEATIMPIKVLTAEGWGTSADIADAIRFAADNGAHVINMSLGSSQPSDVIHNACKYAKKKGVVIVCAAGNSFREGVGYPAAFPECVAVSSVGPTGELAFYSSYGKEVALAAPGGDTKVDPENGGILQNTVFPEDQGGKGDDYYHFQGTSMASPHVAAVAALVMAQGEKDPIKVKDILVRSASPKGEKIKYGAGILNADKATKLTADAAGAPPLRTRWLVFGLLGGLLLGLGRRFQPLGVRLAMTGALGVGLVLPDALAPVVGLDSAWNLVFFSALTPAVLFLALPGRVGGRIVGAFALGVGASLLGSWATQSTPLTIGTFGDAATPWTLANAAAALGIVVGASRAARASRTDW